MIAQVVFDLPLEGPFDYLIPEHLASQVSLGMRVKVSFGHKSQIGFCVGLLTKSVLSQLKPIASVPDGMAAFNELDLHFARDFAAYYGCSLGEALATMLRNKKEQRPSIRRDATPRHRLFQCLPGQYIEQIKSVMAEYHHSAHFLVLVPDIFYIQWFSSHLPSIQIGTRSSVFETDGRYACVMIVDEEDASYRQEQTPMYETRQVLLERSTMFGFDVAFIGLSPSVELMHMAQEAKVMRQGPEKKILPMRLVDLGHYKFLPGMLSPPVKDAIESALKVRKKSVLILNRRGSYRLTRCVECGGILKCQHCESPLLYSGKEGKFLCRYCTFSLPGEMDCPQCKKPSWRSQGIGVEQLQNELRKLFPTAKIIAFERPLKGQGSISNSFDILIATQAVLRFQGELSAKMVAFIDFDAELNRLDMRSAFNAFRLAMHVGSMGQEAVFIQSRNIHHYVLKSLATAQSQEFYQEELKLRRELGFTPFKHWVKVSWRGKLEKSVHQAAHQGYNVLAQKGVEATPPLADAIGRKRDQFRFNVMVQTENIPETVGLIKNCLSTLKRQRAVITTLSIDP